MIGEDMGENAESLRKEVFNPANIKIFQDEVVLLDILTHQSAGTAISI